MAVSLRPISDMTPEEASEFKRLSKIYGERIVNRPSQFIEEIPLLGRLAARYNSARLIEASFFFLKSGDPVIDQKMLNAMKIKDYEMRFGFWSATFWGSIFALLPALKGSPLSTKILFFTVPFSLSYYRSFRRGYDQVNYVGVTYLELLAKQKALLKYLGETDGYLSELKDEFMKKENYKEILKVYGVKPWTNN